MSVFDDLDVDVRSVGRKAQMYFHGTSGQLLRTPEFGEEDHRYLLAHRASLNNLLAESVGYDNIRLEATVAGFEEDQDRVTVRFADGSTEDADVLIGADGLYSKVRAQMFPGTEALEHAGHCAWRAIVKSEHIGVPDDRLIVGGRAAGFDEHGLDAYDRLLPGYSSGHPRRLTSRSHVAVNWQKGVQKVNGNQTAGEYRLTVVSGVSTPSLRVATLRMWATT